MCKHCCLSVGMVFFLLFPSFLLVPLPASPVFPCSLLSYPLLVSLPSFSLFDRRDDLLGLFLLLEQLWRLQRDSRRLPCSDTHIWGGAHFWAGMSHRKAVVSFGWKTLLRAHSCSCVCGGAGATGSPSTLSWGPSPKASGHKRPDPMPPHRPPSPTRSPGLRAPSPRSLRECDSLRACCSPGPREG